MLSGGTSRLSGFVSALQDRFDVPVELLDPFRKIAFDDAKLGVNAADVAPTAAVAVGLALRRPGDR
jgi:type IV pilus assembly protein PilM